MNVNAFPELESVGDHVLGVGDDLLIELMATDLDGDPLIISVSNAPAGSSLQEHFFSWRPGSNQVGTYTVTFIVMDGRGGIVMQSVDLVVEGLAPDPVEGSIQLVTSPIVPSVADEVSLNIKGTFSSVDAELGSVEVNREGSEIEVNITGIWSGDSGEEVETAFDTTATVGFLAAGGYQVAVIFNGGVADLFTFTVLEGPPPVGPVSMDFDLAAGDQEVRRVGDAVSGAIFELQLTIKDAPELGGWGVDLRYDSDQIRYVSGSFQQSDFLPGFFALTEEDEGLVIPGGGVLGSVTSSQAEGVLGTLSFEVLEGFTDSTELVITRILYRLTEGRSDEITVRSTAVITSESLVPKLLGDFDDNGKVDLFDFFLFADAFGGTDPEFDLTDDGKVNLFDFFLFADAFGNEAQAKLLALAEEYLGLPIQPVLAQSFPNPFNPETTIRFSLPVPNRIRLTVYNVAGQQVGILVDDEYRSAGTHEVVWKANGRAGGIYFYRLLAGDFSETHRVVLAK